MVESNHNGNVKGRKKKAGLQGRWKKNTRKTGDPHLIRTGAHVRKKGLANAWKKDELVETCPRRRRKVAIRCRALTKGHGNSLPLYVVKKEPTA